MKTDGEVRIMLRERAKGKTQDQAAARAGMSVRTVRRYEHRDGAIERLIQELEDERAALLSGRRLPAAFNP